MGSSQINLDLTYWVSENETNVVFQHDCLHVAATTNEESDPREIISYCMSEWPSKWNIIIDENTSQFTFAQLSKQNVSSQQLYIWSAPMDVVERYQVYLTSNDISMANEIFYNCTLSRFGPKCQYEIEGYQPEKFTLDKFISDFYSNQYDPNSLTCYTFLQCNRGSPSLCLDWSEICDGDLHCIVGGRDEENCWQIELNNCEDNEFRCENGQCIPKAFYLDDPHNPDCLDQSDEHFRAGPLFVPVCTNNGISEPTFRCEDIICTTGIPLRPFTLTNSCVRKRSDLVLQAMFSDKPQSIDENCWLAFKCNSRISIELKCDQICPLGVCQETIRKTCPPMFQLPAAPVLSGHIYFVYTNNDTQYSSRGIYEPQYVCYNDQLCGGFSPNKTLVSFNNLTCRHPEDFPVSFSAALGRGDWLYTLVRPLYYGLYKCNTIPNSNPTLCDKLTMYQCVNSSKCISKYRVYNHASDCDYGDDEEFDRTNATCLGPGFEKLFYCNTTNECVYRNAVDSGSCDCSPYEYDLCDDEITDNDYARKHISFSTICDGFIELIPREIDGKNQTDETNCEHWQCNNTYTRCDGFWNCYNGADEVDCDPSPMLNCSLQHHLCVSPETYQLTCLPIGQANDGKPDCLGATDEPNQCRSKSPKAATWNFYCIYDTFETCINEYSYCDPSKCCFYRKEENFRSVTDAKYFLSQRPRDTEKIQIIHFAFDRSSEKQEISTKFTHSRTVETTRVQHRQHCHRGLGLRVWLDNDKNFTTTTCLCPPSFYGDICQYQNQRVSLTIQFRAFSDSWRIPFTIIVSLIDDTDQRIVHSHEQLTYLPMRDCQTKFNVYLLYSDRPKNLTRNYSIHVDIYEKISSIYRGSFLTPLAFLFLPVHRTAIQLHIPLIPKTCSNQYCVHGQCINYFDNPSKATFCQCTQGWSGRYCNIPHSCMCSSDSLCIGVSANNRSICLCSQNKFGSRCLIDSSICQYGQNVTCNNIGHCIPIDQRIVSNKKFKCICLQGFTGDRCQLSDTKIILSFNKKITLPRSILVHFIEVRNNSSPENGTTFKTISIHKSSVHIYWSRRFHIAFVEFNDKKFYLITVQKVYKQSAIITKQINPSDRCKHIGEVLNETIANSHLLYRIKFYHMPCQKFSPELSCFYDEFHFCLCTDYDQYRLANCFEFNHTIDRDCTGQSNCQNGASCLQDNWKCPQTSLCACLTCFYGVICQFSTSGFTLSLDAILGYSILPHIRIVNQPLIVKISMSLIILMTVMGLVNGVLSMITFKNKEPRKFGCGLYLFGSSITTLLTSTIFAVKFWILLIAQIRPITNRLFLYSQCVSIDFLLRICLNMDQWLNASVALERAITAQKGINVDKKKTKRAAKFIIFALTFLIIVTNIHDPIYRSLIDEDNGDEKRIWCVVKYPSGLRVFNSVINIFHFIAPFVINLVSAVVIITAGVRQRKRVRNQLTYKQILREQFQQHYHLLVGPFVLIILGIPRLIISFASGCMKSASDSWLFITGYFVSFIPPIITFILFVIPSKTYKKEFQKSIDQYRQMVRTRLRRA